MRKASERTSDTKSKELSPHNLFGPPPLLYGEDEVAYREMLVRFSDALGPRDFIEEMWIHDLTDATWNIIRLRRIQAAILSNRVRSEVVGKASLLANHDPKLMEGTQEEKEEMKKFLFSELSRGKRAELYPRANEKYRNLCKAAEQRVDKDLIQADIVRDELYIIERIEHFIAIAQRRYDAVIRELDRHRFMQNQYDSIHNLVEAEVKSVDSTVSKITNKQVA